MMATGRTDQKMAHQNSKFTESSHKETNISTAMATNLYVNCQAQSEPYCDRANTLITTEEDRLKEMNNIKAPLRLCADADWILRQVEEKMREKKDQP